MITIDDIKRAARLMHSFGENRPGYLLNNSSCIKGPSESPRVVTRGANGHPTEDELSIPICVDSETGDVTVLTET